MAPKDLEQRSRKELIELVVDAHEQREQLEQQLRWFKKQLFGAKSERRIDLPTDPAQGSLGEAIEPSEAPDALPGEEAPGESAPAEGVAGEETPEADATGADAEPDRTAADLSM